MTNEQIKELTQEQKKREIEEMLQKVFANERALDYIHGFIKSFISRYL